MPDPRPTLLATVAATIGAVDVPHPTRVAVEGVTASGKTTFARELADTIAAGGRPARALTMDGWHHPATHRHRQADRPADGYYEDAYDLAAFRREVLDPLGHPSGPWRFRPAIIDLVTDAPVHPPPVEVTADEVLLVDGSFLGKPELATAWDLRIWLDVPFEVASARGAARDADTFGSERAAAEAFATRYRAAFRRYLAECDPVAAADVLIEHTDPTNPLLVRRPA